VGIYTTLDYDMTEAFLIGGSVRYENYSDFGIIFLESKLVINLLTMLPYELLLVLDLELRHCTKFI
jgi:hypothetical protein